MLQVTIQNALSISTTFPFKFSMSILATTTLKVTSLTTGELLSVKSTPGIWLKPFATSLAQFTPLGFTLNTHLHLVLWKVFSINMSPNTHVQHLLELQANSLMTFFSGYQIRMSPSFLETLWLIRI